MARLTFLLLLLANVGLAAWLWHDVQRPGPDFASRGRDVSAVQVVAAVPPSIGAARAAALREQANALGGATCVALAGLTASEEPGVRDAVTRLALGDRVREVGGPGAGATFVFRAPDAGLLAWLGRLQRGLDGARLEGQECPPLAPPAAPPVALTPPPGGRR